MFTLLAPMLEAGEKVLPVKVDGVAVGASFAVCFLGSWTSVTLLCQASTLRRSSALWLVWVLLASLAFGFSAIWSMHFVAALAYNVGLPMDINVPLTLASAGVAVGFTFAAFASEPVVLLLASKARKGAKAKRSSGERASRSRSESRRASTRANGTASPGKPNARRGPEKESKGLGFLLPASIAKVVKPSNWSRWWRRPPADEGYTRVPLASASDDGGGDYSPRGRPGRRGSAMSLGTDADLEAGAGYEEQEVGGLFSGAPPRALPRSESTERLFRSIDRASAKTAEWPRAPDRVYPLDSPSGATTPGTRDGDGETPRPRQNSLFAASESGSVPKPGASAGEEAEEEREDEDTPRLQQLGASRRSSVDSQASGSAADEEELEGSKSAEESSSSRRNSGSSDSDSLGELTGLRRHSITDSSGFSDGATHTSSSPSWLTFTLTKSAKARLKGSKRPPTPLGLQIKKVVFSSVDGKPGAAFVVNLVRAALWAWGIFTMHYMGIYAISPSQARIVLSPGLVAASYGVAFAVTFIACTFMSSTMTESLLTQAAAAAVATVGACALHWTGMAAMTFVGPEGIKQDFDNLHYPAFLVPSVLCIAIFTCMLSNAMLAHTATASRNKLAETVLIKRRAWRLLAQKEAAERADALKSDFVATASHELRTPLHTISGYMDLLCRTPLSSEQQLYTENIKRACQSINLMTRSILDFSKLERGGEETVRPVFVNIRETMENVSQMCEERLELQATELRSASLDAAVQLIIHVDPGVAEHLFIDDVFLIRILINLLSNALKFCAEGHVVATIAYAQHHLIATVSDSGIGIAPRSMKNIFEPFRQADSSLTRVHAGTGLGLAICKQLLNRLHGTIDLDSKVGHGSTFVVRIPIEQNPDTPELDDADGAKATGKPSRGRLAICGSVSRTTEAISCVWRGCGFDVVDLSQSTLTDDLFEGCVGVWTDIPFVKAHEAWYARLTATDTTWELPIFLPYVDRSSARKTESELYALPFVVKMKLPLITHLVSGMVEFPRPHMISAVVSTERPKLVRFVSSSSDITASSVSSASEREASEHGDDLTPQEEEADPVKPYRVLLCEDNPVNAKLGQRVLNTLGYEVSLAVNGKEAVEFCLTDEFDLVLMDCQMPVMDGFAATARIRELEASGELAGRRPILALTANVSQESEERCRVAGLDDFLSKPLRMQDLERALKKHLAAAAAGGALESPSNITPSA